jgi:hypothetical protein
MPCKDGLGTEVQIVTRIYLINECISSLRKPANLALWIATMDKLVQDFFCLKTEEIYIVINVPLPSPLQRFRRAAEGSRGYGAYKA